MSEMESAVREAQACGARVCLGDRDFEVCDAFSSPNLKHRFYLVGTGKKLKVLVAGSGRNGAQRSRSFTGAFLGLAVTTLSVAASSSSCMRRFL